jgi:hypothetical protein
MYRSLVRHCPDATLYVIPFDEKCKGVLQKLNLDRLVVIPLKEFEDEELLKIKPTRSKGEYCWTCTPSIIRYCIQKFSLEACTYLDADLYFFSNPSILLNEVVGEKEDVLITEHRYTKAYDQTERSGIYCVQFMTFKSNENSMKILEWWRNACLDWCYARVEDGKFGDQKYLDDWTTRFEGIVVLKHLGGGVAPWNVQQYDISPNENYIRGYERSSSRSFEVIFYHFHNLIFYTNKNPFFGWYDLSAAVKANLYVPYLFDLDASRKIVESVDSTFDPHGSVLYNHSWKNGLRWLKYTIKSALVRLSV